MKLLDLLKKYIAPGILGGITLDSYRRQLYSQKQEILNKEISQKKIFFFFKKIKIELKITNLAKGNFLNNKSVDFWYFRISRRATVPGLKR